MKVCFIKIQSPWGEGELVGEAVETSNIGLGGSKGLAKASQVVNLFNLHGDRIVNHLNS